MRRLGLLAPQLIALGLLAALAACSRPEPAHDVADYTAHPGERVACQNDRGKVKASSNCINAWAAAGAATSRTFWTTPAPASRVQDPGKL